jgi:hypothetical protein
MERNFCYIGFASKAEKFCYKPLHQMQKKCIVQKKKLCYNLFFKLHQKGEKSATNLPMICTISKEL